MKGRGGRARPHGPHGTPSSESDPKARQLFLARIVSFVLFLIGWTMTMITSHPSLEPEHLPTLVAELPPL